MQLRTVINKVNAAASTQRTEALRFTEEQKIKKVLAPKEWENLKKRLAWHCEAVGKSSSVKLNYHEDRINEVTVKNVGDGRQITLSFNADMPCVLYDTPVESSHIAFRVSADGTMIQFIAKGQVTMCDEISVILINHITA